MTFGRPKLGNCDLKMIGNIAFNTEFLTVANTLLFCHKLLSWHNGQSKSHVEPSMKPPIYYCANESL